MIVTCKGCHKDKPTDAFPVRNDRSGRMRPYCKDCAADIQRVRYASHKKDSPFKHRCTRAKTRAASIGVPFDLTPEYLESIWTGLCPVSGEQIKWETDRSDELAAELDRVIPDLGYTQGNVVFMSRRINRLKNNASIPELENLVKWLKSQSI